MEQAIILRKEIYKIKPPGHVLVGDPLYFEEYGNLPKRLRELVVDYRPKRGMEAGPVIKENKVMDPKIADYQFITMGIYFAPKETIRTYLDDRMYQIQQIKEKEIGVDTARFMYEADDRQLVLKTGGDGYWGCETELYHYENGKRFSDAVIIEMSMPEDETFESTKQTAKYLFGEMQLLKTGQEKERNADVR